MNRKQIAGFIAWFGRNKEALQHFADGGDIQVKYGPEAFRPGGHDKEWNTLDVLLDEVYPVLYYRLEYRIKPEPSLLYEIRNVHDETHACRKTAEAAEEQLKYVNRNGTEGPYTLHVYRAVDPEDT